MSQDTHLWFPYASCQTQVQCPTHSSRMQLLVSKLASASSAVRSMNFYSLPCDLLDQHHGKCQVIMQLLPVLRTTWFKLVWSKYAVCAGLWQDSSYRDAFKHAQTYVLLFATALFSIIAARSIYDYSLTHMLRQHSTRCKSAPQCLDHANMAT